jgi:hypothetical protein
VNYYNDGTSPYWNSNIVHSLVIYEWAKETSMLQMKELLDRFAKRIGRDPDYATVVDDKKGYDYKYPGFVKRNVINKKDWPEFGYMWLRYPGVLSDFAIQCFSAFPEYKHITFHIDEAAVSGVKKILNETLRDATMELDPIYGYGGEMRYGDSPSLNVRGIGGGPYKYEGGQLVEIDHEDDTRRGDFGRVFRANERQLDRRFRDIYPVNLISTGHLALRVEGLPLADWIAKGHRGALSKIGDITWQWSLHPLELIRVRQAMLNAGHLVVSV